MNRIKLPSALVVLAVVLAPSARAQEAAPMSPPPLPSASDAPAQPDAAQAQQPSTPGKLSDSTQEPGTPGALAVPPEPPKVAPPMPKGFLDQVLSYDEATNTVRMGRARRELSRAETFQALGQPELAQQSEAASSRRVIFAVTGGTVIVAGLVTAIVAWAGQPDLNSSFCVANPRNFNDICAAEHNRREVIAGAGIAGGLALGALFGTLAYWSNPEVLTPDQTRAAISRHNAELLKKMRDAQSSGPQLRLTPYASAQGAGLLTTFTF